jgi:hypothetical protein
MMALSSQVESFAAMSAVSTVMSEEKDIAERGTELTDSIVLTKEIRAEIRIVTSTAIGRNQLSGSLELEIVSGQRATDLRMTALIKELARGMAAHWPMP